MIHSYAARRLRENGFKIIAGGKEMLTQEYPKEHKRLITKIIKNSDFKRDFVSTETTTIRDMIELRGLGFKIMKYSALSYNFSWKGQKVVYKLVRNHYPTDEVCNNMPTEHYVEYDKMQQCIRLCGKNAESPYGNGMGGWISIADKRKAPENHRRANPLNIDYLSNSGMQSIMKKMPFGQVEQYFNIEEGVIGITEEGFIACIEKPRHTDMYFIIIYGSRRQGKSILEDNLECIFFLQFGMGNPANKENMKSIRCININDLKPETHTRCMELEEGEFLDTLKMFGQDTTPQPAIYLNPTTKNEYTKVYDGEVGFSVSLPLRQLLKDENIITYNPSWKMKVDASLQAWTNLLYKNGEIRRDVNCLLNARTLEEAHLVVDREVHEKGMKGKIKRILTDIFNTRMIDRSSGVSSRWILDTGNMQIPESAWNVAMLAGLFPYLNTSGIRDELWFALWLRFIIQDIMSFAKTNSIPIMIFMDEIAPILKEKATREIVEQAIRECGSAGVGVVMVSHFGEDVPESIQLHAGYEFVFRTSDEKLISRLRKQKGLSKRQAVEIPNLDQFWCYAFGDFVLYDTDGSKTTNNGKPIKIRIKPPNCGHYAGG